MSPKINCWEDRQCGRGPDGPLVARLGPCLAAVDTTCNGINGGRNGGRLCWAVAGEACCDAATGLPSETGKPCSACRFFRRVKYEEGIHFQFGKPALGSQDPASLHRRLNDISALMTIYRDVFASLAVKPLLATITRQLCEATSASGAGAYLVNDAGELVLEAQAGLFPLRERLDPTGNSPAAACLRSGFLWMGQAPVDDAIGAVHLMGQPIGGEVRLSGVLMLVKTHGRFTTDDEWFLREFSLAAGLGLRNITLSTSLNRLQRADRVQYRFLATLMHTIGSPLATVSLSLQALSQLWDRLDPADRNSLLDTSRERIQRVQTLTHQMLDLAAIRSGGYLADLRSTSPLEILRQEVEARRFQARHQSIEISLEALPDCPKVRADPDGLRLVYSNLLDNAIKYSAGKGKVVRVRLSVPADTVNVCISDQGIGIPPNEIAGVFEKFHRGSNAVASEAPGSGLGLAIVKELIGRYGGQVSVVSTVGEGAAFTLEIPVAPAEPATAPLVAEEPAARTPRGLVDAATGFLSCFGCAKCTAGCPTADSMDLKPHQVMRLLQLGHDEELLAASAPWRCVGCQTCLARCPNGVDIPAALAQVREAALRRGPPDSAGGIPVFDELFLDMVRRRGRANDGLVAFRYRLRTGGLTADWKMGLRMLRAGKMKLRTPAVADREAVARLFEEADEAETPEP